MNGSFVTLDLETVPQSPYVDPTCYAIRGAGPRGLLIEREWLETASIFGDEHVNEQITLGNAPLEATHVVPALHATTCHIVQASFGWRAAVGDKGIELHRKVLQSDQWKADYPDVSGLELVAAAEQELVKAALELLAGACQKRNTIVTFNGKQFDVPLLRARAAIIGGCVNYPPTIPWRRLIYPYADDHHADLRLILSADDRRARGTLQWWAETFDIHAEEHGLEVFGWVREGEWRMLDAYGMCEAQTLVELYEAVRPIL